MTMMVAQPAFAGAGVTELSMSEIDAVAGGPLPAIAAGIVKGAKAAAAAAKAAATACRASNRCMATVAAGLYVADKGVDVALGQL
ncbi:MAG: hypothetical protein K2X31_07280 [Sphingopyxis sp.]|nr:hypothetical protein [Sphingopyxis sp.]